MGIKTIIEKADELDKAIRTELGLYNVSLGRQEKLERARDLIQSAITPLLKYRI